MTKSEKPTILVCTIYGTSRELPASLGSNIQPEVTAFGMQHEECGNKVKPVRVPVNTNIEELDTVLFAFDCTCGREVMGFINETIDCCRCKWKWKLEIKASAILMEGKDAK